MGDIPSEIPAPDSIYAVTGGEPNSEPMVIPMASTVYAIADPSKSKIRRVSLRSLKHARCRGR